MILVGMMILLMLLVTSLKLKLVGSLTKMLLQLVPTIKDNSIGICMVLRQRIDLVLIS